VSCAHILVDALSDPGPASTVHDSVCGKIPQNESSQQTYIHHNATGDPVGSEEHCRCRNIGYWVGTLRGRALTSEDSVEQYNRSLDRLCTDTPKDDILVGDGRGSKWTSL